MDERGLSPLPRLHQGARAPPATASGPEALLKRGSGSQMGVLNFSLASSAPSLGAKSLVPQPGDLLENAKLAQSKNDG